MSNFKVGDKVWFLETNTILQLITEALSKGWSENHVIIDKIVEDIGIDRAGIASVVFPGTDVRIITGIKSLIHVNDNTSIVLENTKPNYYNLTIKGENIDVFDIARGFNLPFTLSSALKYIVRVKGDTGKRINDLEKAVECIQREIKYLKDA